MIRSRRYADAKSGETLLILSATPERRLRRIRLLLPRRRRIDEGRERTLPQSLMLRVGFIVDKTALPLLYDASQPRLIPSAIGFDSDARRHADFRDKADARHYADTMPATLYSVQEDTIYAVVE